MSKIKVAEFKGKAYISAQELLGDEPIGDTDLLVLDIKMLVMEWFALQDHLAPAGFNIAYIFMTAHDVATADNSKEKNAVVLLQIPFEVKDLMQAVDKGSKGILCQNKA